MGLTSCQPWAAADKNQAGQPILVKYFPFFHRLYFSKSYPSRIIDLMEQLKFDHGDI
jgi:hypothetical protein